MARSAAALKPALVADANIPIAPLTSFAIAPENPRTIRPQDTIDALAANLAANGVLTAVICYEEKGKLWITCGGTRYLAAKQQKLAGLPYDRRDKAKAIEAGLAEQVGHAPLHPADEAVAFAAELDRRVGKMRSHAATEWQEDRAAGIRDIANRVGRTPRFVEQRLALATLHPPILQALRENRITVHQAEAWANADVERQEEIWRRDGKRAHELDARTVKHLIDKADLADTDRLARYVGEEAYKAAGGAVRQDLFSIETGPTYGRKQPTGHLDRKLVQKLAREKLAKARAKLEAEGWGEVVATLAVSHAGYGPKGKPTTKAGRAKYRAEVSIDHNGKVSIVRGLRLKKSSAADADDDGPSEADVRNTAEAIAKRDEVNRTCEVAEQIVGRSLRNLPAVALAGLLAALTRVLILRTYGENLLNFDAWAKRRQLYGLASDDASGKWTDDMFELMEAHEKDLERFIALEMSDKSRGDLLALLVTMLISLDDAAKPVPGSSAEQLATLGELAGVDLNAHLTDHSADKVDLPLLRQLVGLEKPPAPAKKTTKPRAKK
jgi:hypothetical protein